MEITRIFLLMFGLVIPFSVYGQQCTKVMHFKKKEHKKAFIGHNVDSIVVNNEESCQSKCFINNRCVSCTFDTETLLCNLSNSNHLTDPDGLVENPKSNYWSAEKTCKCRLKNMTCGYSVLDSAYRCYCKAGYVGKNCEKNGNLAALYPMNAYFQARSVQNNAPDGMLSNVDCTTDATSPLYGSCELKGIKDSFIQIPNSNNSTLDLKGSMTFLAFLKNEQAGPIVNYGTNRYGAHWYIVGQSLFVRMVTRTNRFLTSVSTQIPIRQWNYIGMTYNDQTGNNSLWLNEKIIASKLVDKAEMMTNLPVRIGVVKHDGRRFLKGKLSCLQFYGRALDAFSIQQVKYNCDQFA